MALCADVYALLGVWLQLHYDAGIVHEPAGTVMVTMDVAWLYPSTYSDRRRSGRSLSDPSDSPS